MPVSMDSSGAMALVRGAAQTLIGTMCAFPNLAQFPFLPPYRYS